MIKETTRDCAVQCSLLPVPPLKFLEQPAQPIEAGAALDSSVESDGSESDLSDADYIIDDTMTRYKWWSSICDIQTIIMGGGG